MPHGVVDPDSACRAQRRAFLAGVGPDSPRADVQVASWSPATAPIFLVPGFLAPSKADDGAEEMRRRVYQYWGQAPALSTTESPVHCVWPGGLSSLHDRACEIFYQIKGECSHILSPIALCHTPHGIADRHAGWECRWYC